MLELECTESVSLCSTGSSLRYHGQDRWEKVHGRTGIVKNHLRFESNGKGQMVNCRSNILQVVPCARCGIIISRGHGQVNQNEEHVWQSSHPRCSQIHSRSGFRGRIHSSSGSATSRAFQHVFPSFPHEPRSARANPNSRENSYRGADNRVL